MYIYNTFRIRQVNHRIFIKGESFPGLCMARTATAHSVLAAVTNKEETGRVRYLML